MAPPSRDTPSSESRFHSESGQDQPQRVRRRFSQQSQSREEILQTFVQEIQSQLTEAEGKRNKDQKRLLRKLQTVVDLVQGVDNRIGEMNNRMDGMSNRMDGMSNNSLNCTTVLAKTL